MAKNDNEIDISPMLKDINMVLKGHLSSLLGPIINEKNAIQNVLLNMPYVKRLRAENEVLKRHVFQLKTELESNKKFYEKELENASKRNVKLEVRDTLTNSAETPSKIVELKKEMWRKNEKVNSQEEDDDEDDDEDDLYGDDDDDEEDDSNYESPILTNLRMSLNGNKKNEVVEITSAGTVETSDDDSEIKNVKVWNLNQKEEEEGDEEDNDDEEGDEEDAEEEDEEDDDENEEEDDEEDDEEDEEEEEEEEDEEDDEKEEHDEEDKDKNEDHEDTDQDDDEEELDVEDVEIDGVQYLTTGTENGEIYKCDEDGEIMEDENGDFIICGYFKNGIANFI